MCDGVGAVNAKQRVEGQTMAQINLLIPTKRTVVFNAGGQTFHLSLSDADSGFQALSNCMMWTNNKNKKNSYCIVALPFLKNNLSPHSKGRRMTGSAHGCSVRVPRPFPPPEGIQTGRRQIMLRLQLIFHHNI